MPVYGYECPGCGPFEARQSVARFEEDFPCPACGTAAPRRLALPMLGAAPGAPVAAGPSVPHTHSAGCGCGAAHRSLPARAPSAPSFLTRD